MTSNVHILVQIEKYTLRAAQYVSADVLDKLVSRKFEDGNLVFTVARRVEIVSHDAHSYGAVFDDLVKVVITCEHLNPMIQLIGDVDVPLAVKIDVRGKVELSFARATLAKRRFVL